MSMNQRTSRHGIKQMYYLAIFTLLLALAFFAVGCDSGKKAKIQGMGDTPIVISGGSIQLDLNRKVFDKDNETTYRRANEVLGGLAIYDNKPDNPIKPDINLDLTLYAGNCTVTFQRSLGGNPETFEDIVVIQSTTRPMAVTVILAKTDFRTRGKKSFNFYNGTYMINKVTVTGTGTAPPAPIEYTTTVPDPTNPNGPRLPGPLPVDGKLTVELFAQ